MNFLYALNIKTSPGLLKGNYMPQPTLQEIFEEVKTYIGRSIQVFRIAKRRTREELGQSLKSEGIRLDIESIEEDQANISFVQLKKICMVLNLKIKVVLKCAKNIMENDGRPESELREELLEEINYEIWRRQQEG